MKINIAVVGNLKEKYLIDSQKEYLKRLTRYHNVNIIELAEEKLPKNYSQADISKCLVKEGLKIKNHLSGFVIAMDIKGEQLDSVAFSKKLENICLNFDTITFVIGSSYGISEDIKKSANMLLSFSKMTFPHQLFRIMLLEQIYRATTISNNIMYHK